MYLSRVEVDRNNRQKIKDLTHLGAYHHWVEESFPAEIAIGERRRHLWRLDNLGGKQYLLVLSEKRPDPDKLVTYGVPGTAISKPYDQFLNQIQTGQVLQFRVTANPAYTIAVPGKKQGRVVPHVTIEQQQNWLMTRAQRLGFEMLQAEESSDLKESHPAFKIVGRDWPILRRQKGRGVRLSRVSFEGRLRVKDTAVFRQTLVQGIGREKAFGMGLMTVIPEG